MQLIETAADFQTARSAQALARDLGNGFTCSSRRIGRGGDFRNVVGATLGLRRLSDSFDLVHTWGSASLTAAALGWKKPILHTPTDFPTLKSIRWLRSIQRYRDLDLLCPTVTMHRQLVEHGVGPSRCHVIRPGVEFAKINRRRNSDLRKQLGIAEEDHVILAPGESTPAANHALAVWTTGILHVHDEHYRLLLWGRGPDTANLRRFARQLRQPKQTIFAESRLKRTMEFEDLIPAADLVLVTANKPVPTLPISITMAAALPIVSTVSPTVAELLEDRHTAAMVPKPTPRALAQRILDVRSDTTLQWAMSDMARTEAFEYFSLSRFLDQHRTAYRLASEGKPIDIPATPPGVGSRFHGRT